MMTIAFDAKRAYHNHRGLGNYSRDVIRLLSTFYPENRYLLLNPSKRGSCALSLPTCACEVLPNNAFAQCAPSLWRSMGAGKAAAKMGANIYHGLSQELPLGLQHTNMRSVVTMHDAIFIRYPELYPRSYRAIFEKKNRYACRIADSIITISEQTKRDIIEFFQADERKIEVVYQGCNDRFRQPIDEVHKQTIRAKYALPDNYILTVGAIEPRKNAAMLIETLHRHNIDMPLLIIGAPTTYLSTLKTLIARYGMEQQVLFLHQVASDELPALYAMASVFAFPAIFEGFGLPILEAMCVGTPVVASSGTCFEEVGADAALYADPHQTAAWAEALSTILGDEERQQQMRQRAWQIAEKFSDNNVASNLMQVYKKLI